MVGQLRALVKARQISLFEPAARLFGRIGVHTEDDAPGVILLGHGQLVDAASDQISVYCDGERRPDGR